MLVKQPTLERVEVLPSGHLEVSSVDVILEDGVEISRGQPHRQGINPGGDLTGQPPVVISIADAVWTPEVLAAYEASVQASLAQFKTA